MKRKLVLFLLVTRVADSVCPPTDYLLVAGHDTHSYSTPALVTFRTDPYSASGYRDALVVQRNALQVTDTALLYFAIDGYNCGLYASRKITSQLFFKTVAFLGDSDDAVLIAYKETELTTQYMVLLRDTSSNRDISSTEFKVEIVDLDTSAKVTLLNDVIVNSGNRYAVYIYGERSLQYLDFAQ